MMRIIWAAAMAALALGTSGCASKFRSYDGPEVTRVVVFKEERQLHLLHGDKVLKSYDMELGFAPTGHKAAEGDGRTPEGRYRIDRRNPNSQYHLSIGIDYPRPEDRIRAAALGVRPGGDIFIHGTPKQARKRDDWTAGCIAIPDRQMEDVYAMVRDGTVVDIYPRMGAPLPGLAPVGMPAGAAPGPVPPGPMSLPVPATALAALPAGSMTAAPAGPAPAMPSATRALGIGDGLGGGAATP